MTVSPLKFGGTFPDLSECDLDQLAYLYDGA